MLVPKPGAPGSQMTTGVQGQHTWLTGSILSDELRRADDIRRATYSDLEKKSCAPQHQQGRADCGERRGMTPFMPAVGSRTHFDDVQESIRELRRDAGS